MFVPYWVYGLLFWGKSGCKALTHWGRNKIAAILQTFKCIFLNGNVWIAFNISLTFVPKVPIDHIAALAQIMLGADQATSQYLNKWCLVYWRIYGSLNLNELNPARALWTSNCRKNPASSLPKGHSKAESIMVHIINWKKLPNIRNQEEWH